MRSEVSRASASAAAWAWHSRSSARAGAALHLPLTPRRGKVLGVTHVTAKLSLIAIVAVCASASAATTDPSQIVAQLDRDFQAAVKANDAQTMDRILDENMVLVLGNGTSSTRAELLQEARDKLYSYERQDEDPGTQTVRVW